MGTCKNADKYNIINTTKLNHQQRQQQEVEKVRTYWHKREDEGLLSYIGKKRVLRK